jgi:hypothetical protein
LFDLNQSVLSACTVDCVYGRKVWTSPIVVYCAVVDVNQETG